MRQGREQDRHRGWVLIMPPVPIGNCIKIVSAPNGPCCAGEYAQIRHRHPAQSGAPLQIGSEQEDDEKGHGQPNALAAGEPPASVWFGCFGWRTHRSWIFRLCQIQDGMSASISEDICRDGSLAPCERKIPAQLLERMPGRQRNRRDLGHDRLSAISNQKSISVRYIGLMLLRGG